MMRIGTLDKLLGMILSTSHRKQPSASTGSQKGIPLVKQELLESACIKPPKVEPLLSVYKLTDKDIRKINSDLKNTQEADFK